VQTSHTGESVRVNLKKFSRFRKIHGVAFTHVFGSFGLTGTSFPVQKGQLERVKIDTMAWKCWPHFSHSRITLVRLLSLTASDSL
jgi:hypothetical protein